MSVFWVTSADLWWITILNDYCRRGQSKATSPSTKSQTWQQMIFWSCSFHTSTSKTQLNKLHIWGLVFLGGLGLIGPEFLSMGARAAMPPFFGDMKRLLYAAVVLALWYPLVIQAIKASSHFCCHDVHKLHASFHNLRRDNEQVCHLRLCISLTLPENSNFVEHFLEHYATTEWASFKNFIAQSGHSNVQSFHSVYIAVLS